ncbi:uncharacterized protein B0H18DRAFT_1119954 [Fomitopsis serialis]|uniref:uncharacterized protein n=1 Tax=Fomitopsis serialis TaxID=139415 RepID=UPI002007D375|nr:uncharacterized protein B0H18DRAFT_1119954 [Neoantrodia serialis]KAH9924420.1 hypothetical protein B0H18DRAFT_1119954 [Neoantrodia serialis]
MPKRKGSWRFKNLGIPHKKAKRASGADVDVEMKQTAPSNSSAPSQSAYSHTCNMVLENHSMSPGFADKDLTGTHSLPPGESRSPLSPFPSSSLDPPNPASELPMDSHELQTETVDPGVALWLQTVELFFPRPDESQPTSQANLGPARADSLLEFEPGELEDEDEDEDEPCDLISIADSDSDSGTDPDEDDEIRDAEDDVEHAMRTEASQSDAAQPVEVDDDFDPKARQAPSLESAKAALADIKLLLRPPRKTGYGYKDPKLDRVLQERLEGMRRLLCTYTDPQSNSRYGVRAGQNWISASLQVAKAEGAGPWHARVLRRRTQAYIRDRQNLPHNLYGTWARSQLDNEDFREEIFLHLQSIGEYVKAEDLVHYLDQPDVKERYGTKKTISLATAQRWMKRLGYRWMLTPRGQYVDGHERDDVVAYRQGKFLPRWAELEPRLREWKSDGTEDTGPFPQNRRTVVWFHDESTFYAHDRRKQRWVHKTEKAKPYQKGEGASLMVADFVSADYGWLRAPDHSEDNPEEARVFFKAGKGRDGYFTYEEIQKQADVAMDIICKHFPHDDHVLVFDNARTHIKRAEDALSARKMPKFPPKKGRTGASKYPQGTLTARSSTGDGSPQSFYFPPGHPNAGLFKGMAIILEERGYGDMKGKRAECKGFKCPHQQNIDFV